MYEIRALNPDAISAELAYRRQQLVGNRVAHAQPTRPLVAASPAEHRLIPPPMTALATHSRRPPAATVSGPRTMMSRCPVPSLLSSAAPSELADLVGVLDSAADGDGRGGRARRRRRRGQDPAAHRAGRHRDPSAA